MEGVRLTKEYYTHSAIQLAPDLVGKLLCVCREGTIIRRMITETECYYGSEDTACHASKGKTARTSILYGEGGTAYVYLCYGIHSMLNVVTGPEGHPEAVLIRGVEGAYGPGKMTKELGITVPMNGASFTDSGFIWIEDAGMKPPIAASPRIGIDYASEQDRNRLWRFTIK
jgi:DNA-3-methyladenine glycosylase